MGDPVVAVEWNHLLMIQRLLDHTNHADVDFCLLLFLACKDCRSLVVLVLLKQGLQSSKSLLETAAILLCAAGAVVAMLCALLVGVTVLNMEATPWSFCALAVGFALVQACFDRSVKYVQYL